MIQLIASDMDGTLLNSSSKISPESVLAIKLAQQHGITFMIATGRGRKEAMPLIRSYGLNLPMISANGAQVFDEKGNSLFTIPIPEKTVKEIIAILKKHRLYFELATTVGTYSDSHINRIETTSYYLSRLRKNVSRKLAIALTSAHLESLHVHFVDDFQEVLENPEIEILKFIVFGKESAKILEKAKNDLQHVADITVTSSAKTNLEINFKDAKKGLALKKIAEMKGIPISDVMAIGDNYNDWTMLKEAGISFAMENAPKEIKELTTYVTGTNDEHGVAQAIQRVISEKL